MVNLVDFENKLQEKIRKADEIIRSELPEPKGFSRKIIEAMNYSMTAGGKRIRPILMFESYQMFGGNKSVIEPFMAAIEMIHTQSLIHDDLPAIDNALYRRGRKTTHAVYGEAMGILSGDALLNYAYETAMQALFYLDDTDRSIQAMQILAEKTGIYGMIGGQSVDVENEKNDKQVLDKELLDYIYLNKTATLLEIPLMIGAVLGGAGKKEISCMEQIGTKVGLAFQIQDDILDVTSTIEELGKTIFSDDNNYKTTYVTLFGIKDASRRVECLTKDAVHLLEMLPGEKEFLSQLFLYLAFRKK